MKIIGFQKKIKDLNENLWNIIGFPKENWHRGGTEEEENTDGRAASAIGVLRIVKSDVFASIENWKIKEEEKSAGRAASAIGVLWNFKSSVFAWRFFDFFGTAPNGMQVFRTKMR